MRSESATTAVRKRVVTCRCVCVTLKQHPGSGEETRYLILAPEGSVLHHC